jgi:chromo domain-containing protein 1
MTERTVLHKTGASQEDDAISLTSTQDEEYISEQEFLVERVLAEKKDADNKALYLIFWAGYPEEKSTWEPWENIQDPAILEAWEERKGQEKAGTKTAFDLHNFNTRLAKIELARVERHERRKAKRRRLGIPVSSSEESEFEQGVTGNADDSDSSEAVQSNELSRDERLAKKNTKRLSRNQDGEGYTRGSDTESSYIELPPRRASTNMQLKDESEYSDLDRDFLVGGKKKVQRKALQATRQKRAQSRREASKDDGLKSSARGGQDTTGSALDVSSEFSPSGA